MNISDIAAATTVAGFLAAGVMFYHEKDNAPLESSMRNVETNAVVDRIMRIQHLRCDDPEMMRIVNAQMARYKELTGRDFTLTPC